MGMPTKIHSARGRRYVYLLPDSEGRHDAFRVDRMLGALVGRRDFGAYARDTPAGKSTMRRLWEARARRVRHEGVGAIRFDFAGDGFLRRQVRVTVVARTDAEDQEVESTGRPAVANRTGGGNDGFRRRRITTTVLPRNLL